MPAKRTRKTSSRALARFVLTCFFLSGMTGLIYEVLWTRMIVRIIGSAPFAVSIILTIFMGGLGLGSYLAGRTIDRIDQPARLIRLYGLLELIIGGYGLILPLLILAFEPLFKLAYNGVFEYFMVYNVLTFIGCAFLLVLPVICMGATLPILSRFYVTRLTHLGTHTGRLYGLNTVGASLGALLAGFWLLYLWGIWGTLALAVIINTGIGLACIRVASATRKRATAKAPPPAPVSEAAGGSAVYSRGVVNASLLVFAVSGFCAMSYEVIWTKLLALLVGPTTYSFTIVLVTFILGLALGSMFFGWLGDRTRKPLHLLATTQVAAAVLALVLSQLLGNSQLFFAKLIGTYKDDFTLLSGMKALILFALMFPPTFCLGATFPLVGKIYTASAARVGRSIGTAYAINTIGAVLGSFVAGFIIVPAVGMAVGLSLATAAQLVSVILLMMIAVWSGRPRAVKWAPVPVVAVIALILCLSFPQWNHHLLASGKYHRFEEMGVEPSRYGWLEALLDGSRLLEQMENSEVVYYADGIAGTTTVLKDTDAIGNIELSMANSGKAEASTRGDMTTQTILAHFALMFHPDPNDVMVIGLASGITAGEALHYPVERLDVVEISSEVVKASELFRPWNNHVLEEPRTHLIIQDARAHLKMTERSYDVVISEPSNPWMAGLAALFTKDFFSQVYDRLHDGGIFVQFIHSYQMNWETFAMVGRTFCDVYENAILVSTAPGKLSPDYMLIGIKGDRRLSLDVATGNLRFIRQSRNVELHDPRLLYTLIKSENLAEMFGSGPLNTDSHPRLEYAAPRLLYYVDPTLSANIKSRARFHKETAGIQTAVESDVDAQLDLVTYALSVHAPLATGLPDVVDFSLATKDQVDRYFDLIDTYCSENPGLLGLFPHDSSRHHCALAQMARLQQMVDSDSADAPAYSYLAWLYFREGRADKSIAIYERWLERYPDDAEFRNKLGRMLIAVKALPEALSQFQLALQEDSTSATTHLNLGEVHGYMGNFVGASYHFEQAIELNPRFAEAHAGLGKIKAATGKYEEAAGHFSKALKYKPDYPEARAALNRLRAMGAGQ